MICGITVVRHIQLFLEVYANNPTVASYLYEEINLILSIIVLVLEITVLWVKPLNMFRCTFNIVFIFFQTAQTPSIYYLTKVSDEPVYGFRYCSV
jgi:hypothetical protein